MPTQNPSFARKANEFEQETVFLFALKLLHLMDILYIYIVRISV